MSSDAAQWRIEPVPLAGNRASDLEKFYNQYKNSGVRACREALGR